MASLENRNGKLRRQTRPKLSLYLAEAKRVFVNAIESIAKNTIFRVNIENQKDDSRHFSEISSKLESLKDSIEAIEIPDNSGRITSSFEHSMKKLKTSLHRVVSEISLLRKSQKEVVFPKNQKVSGELSLSKNKQLQELSSKLDKLDKDVQDVKITDSPKDPRLDKLLKSIEALRKDVQNIHFEVPEFPEQKEVKIPPFPKTISMQEAESLRSELEQIRATLASLPDMMPRVEFPTSISVDNFPRRKYPVPPTNININSLRGPVLSTSVSVGSIATLVPSSAIENRRGVILFNNSTSTTIFIGGENVNSTDGLPVPAQQYSPPLDIGDRVDLYAITASGNADVRILEVSMDNIGS